MTQRHSISTAVTACLATFRGIQAQAESPDYRHEEEVALSAWTDELGRLRVWRACTEAHQKGQFSLEARLPEKRQICEQVMNLLAQIDESLTEALGLMSEEKPGSGAGASEDNAPSGTEDSALLVIEDDGLLDSSWQTTDLEMCYDAVVNSIDCLMTLSTIIRERARVIPDRPSEGSSKEEEEDASDNPLAPEPDPPHA